MDYKILEIPGVFCPNSALWDAHPEHMRLLTELNHPQDLWGRIASPMLDSWADFRGRQEEHTGFTLVSGAMTSVGECSPEDRLRRINKNFKAFQAAIWLLAEEGLEEGEHFLPLPPIFSQMPFEGSMDRFHKQFESDPENQGKYPQPILDYFYKPLIERHVAAMVLLPGWNRSFGARWEVHQFENRYKGNGLLLQMTEKQLERAVLKYPLSE